jgi:DNA mismatch endonuclease, patch repair protein
MIATVAMCTRIRTTKIGIESLHEVVKFAPKASSEAVRIRMQAVKQRDTPAEVSLRSALHRLGFRFRVDCRPVKEVPRRADIVFYRKRIAVFVDGCFWHGCPLHATWPKTNAGFWRSKIMGNRERDNDTDARLRDQCWTVVRFWEHEIRDSVVECAERIAIVIAQGEAKSDN